MVFVCPESIVLQVLLLKPCVCQEYHARSLVCAWCRIDVLGIELSNVCARIIVVKDWCRGHHAMSIMLGAVSSER